jgi:molybdopterin-guanine dinucleotide biosynthesis protein A
MTDAASSRIAGVVLAGGLSRRMGGGDKALRPLAGKTMIHRVVERLAPQVAETAINANGDPARFSSLGLPVFEDTVGYHSGPLAGILSAMRWAGMLGYAHVVTAASDTPFFPPDLVDRLAGAASTADTIVMATSDGNRHPVFALWPVALAGDLADWLADTDTLKVMSWAKRHDLTFCDFAIGENGLDPFFNANTPEDFAQAEAFLGEVTA